MKNTKKIVALTVVGLCLGDVFIPNLLKVYGTESDQPVESNVLPIQDIVEENGGANDLVESNEPNPAPPSELIDSSNLIEDVDVIEEDTKEPITEASTETEIINSVTPIEEKIPVSAGVKASGTFGTSPWILDSEGTLTFSSGEFDNKALPAAISKEQVQKIIFTGKVVATRGSMLIFENLSNLKSIENLNNFDTSNVTNMVRSFSGCSSLTELDLTFFDTSQVTDMSYMFQNCRSLINLNVTQFDTSNVRQMLSMFEDCSSLTELNVTNFDTSNVTHMWRMFQNCTSLRALDISNFVTPKLSRSGGVSSMFSGCSNLISLDISNIDNSGVSSAVGNYNVFQDCNNLKQIKLGSLSTFQQNNQGLPNIDSSNEYTGGWVNSEMTNSYKDSTSFMKEYDGKSPGIYVWERNETIDAKNSSMYVGDKWNEEDNFVSATDKAGNPVVFDPAMVSGSVDTTKAGEYPITYTNGAVKKEIIVTVKENKTSIDAKNSSMYVGDKWNEEDNFVSATDKSGNPVVFDPAMVSGSVDTTKAGEYPITYTNGAVKKEIIVTVKENKTSMNSTSISGENDKETRNSQRLPQAGEVQSYNILGLSLLSLVTFIASKRKRKN
ncbi:bacterial Ig-like domain-containing protein [Carnobacterium maltaromaticum]|uniref:bacterial Ig-like domain-containing protein n=1 Tax=Carnobacterium maltaromaticum TaxID=2751 RepID=UPI0039AF8024